MRRAPVGRRPDPAPANRGGTSAAAAWMRYLLQVDAATGLKRGLLAVGVELEPYDDRYEWDYRRGT